MQNWWQSHYFEYEGQKLAKKLGHKRPQLSPGNMTWGHAAGHKCNLLFGKYSGERTSHTIKVNYRSVMSLQTFCSH